MTIQEYNDLYKNTLIKKVKIVTSGGITITNTNICTEEMSLEESLCSDSNLNFGACESACFKVRIADLNYNFEGEWLDVSEELYTDVDGYLLTESGDFLLTEGGDKIKLENKADGIAYFGRFKVHSDKPTNDRRWRDLTCYDVMYDILNADMLSWFNSLTFPMTIKALRDSFFSELGITQETTTLVNDTFVTDGGFSVDGALSGKDVITAICELNGVFGHISREGVFKYISLPSTDTIALDWYMDGTGTYEDYTVSAITGITARSSDSDVGTSVGTGTNVYIIRSNPLIFGAEGTQGLETALTNLLDVIDGITYRPFQVSAYGNPMLPIGTNLVITTRDITINSFVMTRVLSGIQSLKDTYTARGEKQRPTQVNSLRGEVKRTKGKIHELVNTADELRSTIEDLDENVTSEIQQLSDEVVLKVDASGNIVKVALTANASDGARFAVNADNISFTAGSVMKFLANNIQITSTNFTLDASGNVICNNLTATNADISGRIVSSNGQIGGWTLNTSGLRYGVSSYSDYSTDGIFVGQNGLMFNRNTTPDYASAHSILDGTGFRIYENYTGNNGLIGYLTNGTGSGNKRGCSLSLGCVDEQYNINPVHLEVNYNGLTIWRASVGEGNRGIDSYFWDNNWVADHAIYNDVYNGLQTCSTTKTELEYLSGTTGNIQTQIDDLKAHQTPARIFGVEWDGSSSPSWKRTDASEYFADPSPAVNNGTGSSPFDMLMPWAGMAKEFISGVGTVVKIPKFWFKWTKSGSSLKLQIADGPVDGFSVSPAHQDRGDGKGERDYVYVGRYVCNDGYGSGSAGTPDVGDRRAIARANISALHSYAWQWDYAMLWTIRMLYLVEFANWNSQAMIGYGRSASGSVMTTGYTNSMQYHTGTTATSRTTYGGTQYRHIEGLWDNVFTWVDGINFGWTAENIIMNPSAFSDSGGTNVGAKIAGGNGSAIYGLCLKSYNISSVDGFEWVLIPAETTGNEDYATYTCDRIIARNYGGVCYVGGNTTQNRDGGLFFESQWEDTNYTSSAVGSRLMYLP